MQKLTLVRVKSGDVFVVLFGQLFERVFVRQQTSLHWDGIARDTQTPTYRHVLNFVVKSWTMRSRGQPGRWDLLYRTSSIPIKELSAALSAFEVVDVKI